MVHPAPIMLIPTLLCPKSWQDMSGDETQRFCTHCRKHVHNLDALSVTERLALLQSPAAAVCGRYRVAIRQPVAGREAAYFAHLAKYGAGVAIAGTVLLVLWEMQRPETREQFYRAAGLAHPPGREMPPDYYVESETMVLGMIMVEPEWIPRPDSTDPASAVPSPPHVDLQIDSAEVLKLTPPLPLPPVRINPTE